MSERTVPQLVLEVVDSSLELVKSELAIARASISRAVAGKALGIAALTGALFIALLAVIFLVLALYFLFASFMGQALAALITGLIILVVSGLLAALGLRKMRGEPDANA